LEEAPSEVTDDDVDVAPIEGGEAAVLAGEAAWATRGGKERARGADARRAAVVIRTNLAIMARVNRQGQVRSGTRTWSCPDA